MVQVTRDLDDTLQRYEVRHSGGWITASGLLDGCRIAETLWSEDARPCRSLRDRGHRAQDESADSREFDGRVSATPWDSALRSLDDKLAAGPGGWTTFGDNGRQNFGLRIGAGIVVMKNWRRLAFQRYPLQGTSGEVLTTSNNRFSAGPTHTRGPMRSKILAGKASETTTKNDNIQNRLGACVFWPRRPGRLMNAAARSNRDAWPPEIDGREAVLLQVIQPPGCPSIVEECARSIVRCHNCPRSTAPFTQSRQFAACRTAWQSDILAASCNSSRGV